MKRSSFIFSAILFSSVLASCSSTPVAQKPHESRFIATDVEEADAGTEFLDDEKRDENISKLRKAAKKKNFHFEIQFAFRGNKTPDYARIDRLVQDLKGEDVNEVHMGADAREMGYNGASATTVSFEFNGSFKKVDFSVAEAVKRFDEISSWQFVQIEE